MSVDKILNERHATYGTFYGVASIAVHLRNLILDEAFKRNKTLSPDQEEAFVMIASKVARIVNGDPNHVDSWRDIAGYASLVADRLEGKAR